MNPETPIPLETVKATMNAYTDLYNRAEHIARLIGSGSTHVDFGDGYRLEDPRATMTFSWEVDNYDGPADRESMTVPLRYLWANDADIVAEVEQEQRAKESAERERAVNELLQQVRAHNHSADYAKKRLAELGYKEQV